MTNEMHLYITDQSGKRYWRTSVSAGYAQGERRNLLRHLDAIKANHPSYAACGIDAATARLVEEGEPCEISDDELLAELLS